MLVQNQYFQNCKIQIFNSKNTDRANETNRIETTPNQKKGQIDYNFDLNFDDLSQFKQFLFQLGAFIRQIRKSDLEPDPSVLYRPAQKTDLRNQRYKQVIRF